MTHAMTTWTTRGAGRAVALPWVALAAAHATAAVTELKPQAQLAHWVGKNQAALDRGARLTPLQYTSPGEDSAPQQLQQDEPRALQAWQVRQLGIAIDSPPREQDCQLMLDGLSAGAPNAPRQKAP